jgi:hypothetical protein
MIKKYCSCVRAVQNNGKNGLEIAHFVREITGGKYNARRVVMSKAMLIFDASNDSVLYGCDLGQYIVAGHGSKVNIISPEVFESLFEECE